MTETKHLDFAFDVKEVGKDNRTFSGYASVFGQVDQGRDIVMPGAFTESLAKWRAKGKMPRMFYHHDTRRTIGRWTDMKEDDYGLFVEGKLTEGVQDADEAYALLKDDAIDGLSIGYRTVDSDYDRELQIRKLKTLSLMETSIVSMPMLESAEITMIKAATDIKTIRDFEHFLRDVGGYSHAAAKAIAAGGFKSLDPRDEDGATGKDDIEALHRLAEFIRA